MAALSVVGQGADLLEFAPQAANLLICLRTTRERFCQRLHVKQAQNAGVIVHTSEEEQKIQLEYSIGPVMD